MEKFFVYVWKHTWCRLVLIATLGAIPLLHPFMRQSVFGPTIGGIPCCVYEEEVRRRVHPDPPQMWLYRTLAKFGLIGRKAGAGVDLNNPLALPLYVRLAEDPDVKVRQLVLERMQNWLADHEAEVLPVFRRHVADSDPKCRFLAASGIWRTTKDREMIAVVLAFKDHPDPPIRLDVAYFLVSTASADPVFFDPLSKLAQDPDANVRFTVVSFMRYFGKRGVPILRQALHDSDNSVRDTAIYTTSELGQDGLELIPILQAFLIDPNANFRRHAAEALHKLDPKQFPKPAEWHD